MDQLLVLKNFKLDQLDVDPENSGGMIDKDQVVVRTPSPPSGSTHVNNNWILWQDINVKGSSPHIFLANFFIRHPRKQPV